MKDEREFYTYILTNQHGMLYVGVTADLPTRIQQHRDGTGSEYTKKYQCHKLVYYESSPYILNAIEREKQIKKFSRKKKEELIKKINPKWIDLSFHFGDPNVQPSRYLR